MNLSFFDIETSGLDFEKNDLIQLAVVQTNRELQVTYEWERKVQFDMARADKKALEINGYTSQEWRHAWKVDKVLDEVWSLFSYTIPAGHNIVNFDLPWMRYLWKLHPKKRPKRMDYHALDTMCLAWPLLYKGKVENLKLATLCRYLDIKNDKAHDALADVKATIEVARRLIG